jgi:hypothetical protein
MLKKFNWLTVCLQQVKVHGVPVDIENVAGDFHQFLQFVNLPFLQIMLTSKFQFLVPCSKSRSLSNEPKKLRSEHDLTKLRNYLYNFLRLTHFATFQEGKDKIIKTVNFSVLLCTQVQNSLKSICVIILDEATEEFWLPRCDVVLIHTCFELLQCPFQIIPKTIGSN